MYAIVEDGGKQYRVQDGDTIYIETRQIPEGARTVEFDRVLMVGDGKKSRIGTPCVDGAKVLGRLEREAQGPKLEIVKYARRKGYHLHKGHRQDYLKVTIEKISC
ncbi:MAG TPA: 50S ribosomal protein L21 [Phycisphaerae bacterium]|nr:50S ribosomal protein L21 [Phycisphaerae bacterium]